jgi:hypothetical protein
MIVALKYRVAFRNSRPSIAYPHEKEGPLGLCIEGKFHYATSRILNGVSRDFGCRGRYPDLVLMPEAK